MRAILLAVAISFLLGCSSTEQRSHVVSEKERNSWPKSVKDAVSLLIAELSETDKEEIRGTPKENLIKYHHGWGMAIRNGFGLWRGNEALMKDTGAEDPDGASMVLIRAVWEALQKSD